MCTCVQLPFLKPYRHIADSILSFLFLPILINIIDISMRKKILMYKKGNICLICRLFCARFSSTHSKEYYTILIYVLGVSLSLSLSFHRDTIYLFYIYIFFYLITVAVGARTACCAWAQLFSLSFLSFFRLNRNWSDTYVYRQ